MNWIGICQTKKKKWIFVTSNQIKCKGKMKRIGWWVKTEVIKHVSFYLIRNLKKIAKIPFKSFNGNSLKNLHTKKFPHKRMKIQFLAIDYGTYELLVNFLQKLPFCFRVSQKTAMKKIWMMIKTAKFLLFVLRKNVINKNVKKAVRMKSRH